MSDWMRSDKPVQGLEKTKAPNKDGHEMTASAWKIWLTVDEAKGRTTRALNLDKAKKNTK